MQSKNVLAQPFTLPNGVEIKNRLVKSAMSEALGDQNFAPTPQLTTLYKTWANGGIGLSITGNVMIDHRALGEPRNVVIEDESHLEALQTWAKAATANNTACWVQLNHPGKQSPKGLNKENVSPSAVPFKKHLHFFPIPRELTDAEIRDLIQRFANAARIVKKAGFTGVQIHGAHGYLVSQFLSPLSNLRTDDWGGSPEKRRRFVLAVYQAMREQVGADFPIGIKLNSADFQRGGFTEEESLDTIHALSAAGIDLIEISGGTYEAPAMTGVKKESTRQREAYFMAFADKARQVVHTPLVVTGGFRSLRGMSEAIESNAVDFVGLGRSLAIETDLPNRLLTGEEPLESVRAIKTHISLIDKSGIMEILWYTSQLKRIGDGKAPKPNESGLWAFVKYIGRQLRFGRKKSFTKLRAS